MVAGKAAARRTALESEFSKALPVNRLSVEYNHDSSECVVKMGGETRTEPLLGDVVRIYTDADHPELLAMMQGRGWAGTDAKVEAGAGNDAIPQME